MRACVYILGAAVAFGSMVRFDVILFQHDVLIGNANDDKNFSRINHNGDDSGNNYDSGASGSGSGSGVDSDKCMFCCPKSVCG